MKIERWKVVENKILIKHLKTKFPWLSKALVNHLNKTAKESKIFNHGQP